MATGTRVARQSRDTVYYRMMQRGIPEFFAAAELAGRDVPKFIADELTGFLDCGDLARGFAKVDCHDCGHHFVVGFSCKGRGACLSCAGRRMADISLHLHDRVLPDVPYRQFVMTLPPPLRYLAAFDSKVLSRLLGCFVKALFGWQRREAKRRFGLASVKDAIPAAVTAIHRSGSAGNLNPHFHTLAPDGVWCLPENDGGNNRLVFRQLGRPGEAELADIGWDACNRAISYLRSTGRFIDDQLDMQDDWMRAADEEPLLTEVYGASISGRIALGPGRGNRALVLRRALPSVTPPTQAPVYEKPGGEKGYVFDVHGSVSVQRGDRHGLLRLCKYLLRPALGIDRFEETSGGRVALRFKRPWSDGTSHVVLTPLQLVQRVVALIPKPRTHTVRYHGAFAPNSKFREMVIPKPTESCPQEPKCIKPGRQAWAMLLKRVFSEDIEKCLMCDSTNTKVSFITDKTRIKAYLPPALAA